MALNASKFAGVLDRKLLLPYVLPYANFHEARVNWRPLLFEKLFKRVENSENSVDAMSRLAAPNAFVNWTGELWPASPTLSGSYSLEWSSSTSPPVISPWDFAAYGYGSCSAWSTLLTYAARAVGIPARQTGAPCWNDLEFKGLAKDNPNVSLCWHGGASGGAAPKNSNPTGGKWLNNRAYLAFRGSLCWCMKQA